MICRKLYFRSNASSTVFSRKLNCKTVTIKLRIMTKFYPIFLFDHKLIPNLSPANFHPNVSKNKILLHYQSAPNYWNYKNGPRRNWLYGFLTECNFAKTEDIHLRSNKRDGTLSSKGTLDSSSSQVVKESRFE